MVAHPGQHRPSFVAGEVSDLIQARPGLKQFYQAARRMLHVEPVPQAGFRYMPGTRYLKTAASGATVFRHAVLNISKDLAYTLCFTPGRAEIFRNDGTHVAGLDVTGLTAAILAECEFFGEAATFGIFHHDLWPSLRIVRESESVWTVDDWPYERIPDVNLGGTYAKTDDEWVASIRWDTTVKALTFSLLVDGELTNAVTAPRNDGGTGPGDPNSTGADGLDWLETAVLLQAELVALPSLGTGVTVTFSEANSFDKSANLNIVFGGDLSGREYDVDVRIVNTAAASALSNHTQFGKTAGEPLFSVTRGGPAALTMIQDRATYLSPKARQAAFVMSRVAEYFDLNIEAVQDDAARLDALRTSTSEVVHAAVVAKYLLCFTDTMEYFVPNRTIERNTPLNFVETGNTGSRRHAGVKPLGNRVFYVSKDGNILYSTAYDEVSSAFSANPESLLAHHLVRGIKRLASQRGTETTDANRLWLLRDDGRLVVAAVIQAQDIAGFCEWGAAGGTVKEVSCDALETVFLSVQRTNGTFTELLDPNCLFQSAITGQTDLSGVMTGLDHLEGQAVYAKAGGYIYGPHTVVGGKITLEDAWTDAGSVLAGVWQQPLYESMPHYAMTQADELLHRPGRIHTARINVIETQSIAVGANGGPVRDVPLMTVNDAIDQPFAGRTGMVTVAGMGGMTTGPTLTITQTRPGTLQVRDITTEAKL